MTSERARYILKNLGPHGTLRWAIPCPLNRPPFYTGIPLNEKVWPDGITLEEWNYLSMIWGMMRDSSSLYDAVEAVAKGI